MVPTGKRRFYETISEITNSVAGKDTYILRGNHDTGVYTEYFGLQNYALIGDSFTVVVLDNAMRTFEAEGLELLGRVLAMEECRNVVIAFHIPLPNHFIRNSVSEAEFERLRAVYAPYREKVKYFACGHVHSRFGGCGGRDSIDLQRWRRSDDRGCLRGNQGFGCGLPHREVFYGGRPSLP